MNNQRVGIECKTSNGDSFFATGFTGNRMTVSDDRTFPFSTVQSGRTQMDEQFRRYEAAAQQPEGLIALSDLPGKIDDLSVTMPGTTTVYLD